MENSKALPESGVVVITGGSQGLGVEIAKACVARGYSVALLARREEELKLAADALRSHAAAGARVASYPVDLTDANAVERVFADIYSEFGAVRALVNNAATWLGTCATSTLHSDDFKKGLELNFFTAVNATSSLLKKRGERSFSPLSVVNIGATASLSGWNDVAAYCVSKGALRFYSQALARECGPKGVHVAHVIIDGVLDNPRTRGQSKNLSENSFMNQRSVAHSILFLIEQEPSCWTFEMDLRPFVEEW